MTGADSLILLVRLGRMGDMAMFTSALQASLDAFPSAAIHLVTSREGDRLLREYHPRLTRTVVYSRSLFESHGARRRVRRLIREHAYDRCFVFETNPHYHEVFADAAADVHLLTEPARGHRIRQEIAVLAGAGAWSGEPPWPSLAISKDGEDAARALLRRHGIADADVVVGFHPTSGYLGRFRFRRGRLKHRAWPAGSFAELARLLARHASGRGRAPRIVVDVLPEERRYADEIRQRAGDLVTVLAAPPDLERYKAVLRRMRVLVTIDTGPMHVAAALGTPMVALFSDTDPEVIGPFMPADRYAVLHADDMPDPSPGMAAIPAPLVFEACVPLLDEG